MFYNPTIEKQILENSKPELNVLVDDSKSITFFEQQSNVLNYINDLKNSADLNQKFDMNTFRFGNSLDISDTLAFVQSQTNINDAIVKVNDLEEDNNSAILLLTDGNQTIGNDYEYLRSNLAIYPVVFGDTMRYQDVSIENINVNKYSYLNNEFPVEILLNYEGAYDQDLVVKITKDGKTVFRKNVSFTKDKRSHIINTNLEATAKGTHFYDVSISRISNEKNIKNNLSSFSIEVIDEKSKVAILSSILHPDLGALKKAIETNKERKADIFIKEFNNFKLSDYQGFIVYQPNENFKYIFNRLKELERSFLVISGMNTDWRFVNQLNLGIQKDAIDSQQFYYANFNASFLSFLQDDIGFNEFPPLSDQFGEVTLSAESDPLLFQSINGIETTQPLFTILKNENRTIAFLLGEGMWKWRAADYRRTSSFLDFDKFMSNTIQLLTSNKKRNRLEVVVSSEYPSNESILIKAYYTDQNYRFDNRANIQLISTHEMTKEQTILPFSLANNVYEVNLDNLPSGNYDYKVQVLNQDISQQGSFRVLAYSIEEQFVNANEDKLKKLALNSNGRLFYPSELKEIIQTLINNEGLQILQKSNIEKRSLIDFRWLLFFIVGLLSAEWFVRKYFGKL